MNRTVKESIDRMSALVASVPDRLKDITEENWCLRSSPGKWSKKEILGHLIDSAANNHQRFIRGQFETAPAISYDQNQWNRYGFYQEIDTQQLIAFWTNYNQQLIEIAKRIPPENLSNLIRIGDHLLPLETVLVEYVEHLEHHLQQLVPQP